jgi:hypothetical protein
MPASGAMRITVAEMRNSPTEFFISAKDEVRHFLSPLLIGIHSAEEFNGRELYGKDST